jgi:hypothetical protein
VTKPFQTNLNNLPRRIILPKQNTGSLKGAFAQGQPFSGSKRLPDEDRRLTMADLTPVAVQWTNRASPGRPKTVDEVHHINRGHHGAWSWRVLLCQKPAEIGGE